MIPLFEISKNGFHNSIPHQSMGLILNDFFHPSIFTNTAEYLMEFTKSTKPSLNFSVMYSDEINIWI